MKKIFIVPFTVLVSLILISRGICAGGDSAQQAKFQLKSPAFHDGETVPDRYTCAGANINPGLIIANIPEKTKSLALIVDNPDAPEGVWVHWVVYNIHPDVKEIKEKSNPGIQGLNDFGRFRYQGPCPSDEKLHKYHFKVYALDIELELLEGVIKSDVEQAMRGHILDQAELVAVLQIKNIKTNDD